MGYSGGSTILPWYTPPSKSESGGPRTEKCHSKRLSWSHKEMSQLVQIRMCEHIQEHALTGGDSWQQRNIGLLY